MISLSEDSKLAESAELPEKSIESRLIDKIADFEGKTEALRALRENLYAAIDQLESY